MKIDDNGTIREITAEEIASMAAAQEPEQTEIEKLRQRIDEIELALCEVSESEE